jgi:hypothetical protein
VFDGDELHAELLGAAGEVEQHALAIARLQLFAGKRVGK